MNRPLLFLLFSVIVFTAPAPACMNDYDINGEAIARSQSVLEQLEKHSEKEPWQVRRDRLREELAAGGGYKKKNDLAVALAHTGAAEEAVALLEQIEAEKPGLYVTAANLGTAYELSGNDEKALEWIRKGIERNPHAHEKTEWLHVRILEAKLALKADPMWFKSHSVLGPRQRIDLADHSANPDQFKPFTFKRTPKDFAVTGNRGEELSPDEIKTAIIYQLHERLQFAVPPNPIVGDLLIELGYLLAEEPTGVGGARDVYDLAKIYLRDAPNVNELQAEAELQERAAGERQVRKLGFVKSHSLAISAVTLTLLVIILKRWIKRQRPAKLAQVST